MLTKNFSEKELACRCCGVCKVTIGLMAKLQELRDEFGKPLNLTSGYRCPEHNKKVGGVPNSYHLKGMAVDIDMSKIRGFDRYKLISLVFSLGFTGVGIDKEFIHIDVQEGLGKSWGY